MAFKARALTRRGEFVERPRVGDEIVIGKYVGVCRMSSWKIDGETGRVAYGN